DHIDVNALPWNGRWRDLAGQYCQALLSVLQEHPHAVTTFATRPIRSNSSISSGVRMIECFVAGGFSPENSLRVARSLRELTIGHALSWPAVSSALRREAENLHRRIRTTTSSRKQLTAPASMITSTSLSRRCSTVSRICE